MAKRQKPPEEDHSNDWLATYGDMVTLLLTFFVLLYASSSLDDQKWQYIYQAFQSHGKYINEYVDSQNKTAAEGDGINDVAPSIGGEGQQPQSFDQLYVYLSQYISDNNLEGVVSVSQGAAHINIRFDDNVFFAPNSEELLDQGKEIIDGISPAIKAVEGAIQRVTVNGHTAQGISSINDWDLSSGRACSVVKYMEFRKVVGSEKFRVGGSGPTEPIADNSTEEGRAKNRRVEMVILKNDLDMTDPEVLKDIMKYDYGLDLEKYDPFAPEEEGSKLPNDSAQAIIDSIDQMFPDGTGSTTEIIGPTIPSDYESFFVTTEEEAGDAAADADSAE